uniref:Uncharacterized protein n=1 Tax=Coccidioides posadasii RMSCC 3488 TaxID=454284 RepID=A0A0J6FAH4_COCPO|nr:hypothetical protein CPAG_02575 [Coccidioides posadasii RMSCC 3488]
MRINLCLRFNPFLSLVPLPQTPVSCPSSSSFDSRSTISSDIRASNPTAKNCPPVCIVPPGRLLKQAPAPFLTWGQPPRHLIPLAESLVDLCESRQVLREMVDSGIAQTAKEFRKTAWEVSDYTESNPYNRFNEIWLRGWLDATGFFWWIVNVPIDAFSAPAVGMKAAEPEPDKASLTGFLFSARSAVHTTG